MDPLLTSLCGICHIREPKYKCPRCGANTCSLPCVKKHKKWSSCNGQRDPTVYMPPAKLRTDAGIDHDYNYLTGIERNLEQVDKLLVDERGILPGRAQQNDRSHGPPHKKARMNKGTEPGPDDSGRRFAIMGAGSRQKAEHAGPRNNTTSFNKRSQTINWQVEWCFLDPAASSTENSSLQPEKLLNKTLDSMPTYLGYDDCREYHRRSHMSKKEKEQERKQRQIEATGADDDVGATFGGQDWENSTWAAATMPVQRADGSWCTLTTVSEKKPIKPGDRQRRADNIKAEYQFYFHVPGTPSREPQKLIPINAEDSLASVLSGMEVLEFPSIYVTRAGMQLPQGYQLAERHANNSNSQKAPRLPQKRKSEALVEYGTSEDEGEIAEASDELESEAGVDPADTTSSSGSDPDEEMGEGHSD
ncbi:hypothetical protein PG994_001604 [Apiospora phragmitis]|uniref:HIT-type domain-containing protein n=1 Tax=Apiospora phragmitis TaxID=2905665 RepID=A0ABR1WU23_9PEZI